MASDFNKIMYHAVQDRVRAQMGEEQFAKFDKHQWRKLMDMVMQHFALSLVTIVASVSEQQARAKAEADAAAKSAEPESSQPATVTPEVPPEVSPSASAPAVA